MLVEPFAPLLADSAVSIRDPLHGAIEVGLAEMELLEHPAMQRLRDIKQLGFAEIPYPGACHSRFLHSVGAMWVATRMWDALVRQLRLEPEKAAYFRRLVRAAVLLHDIGHAPLSHITEHLMPPVQALGLPAWLADESKGRATHEDYSLKLLLESSLTPLLEDFGLEPAHLAGLISGQPGPHKADFVVGAFDLFPLLRQIVSSELDADRMDYLLRDSLFTGVTYGNFDLDWLIRNLVPVEREGRIFLGLSSRALFAFEDFLLSRYHMFFSVYFHHTSVCYQEMLIRYAEEEAGGYRLPLDAQAYLKTDDIEMLGALRQSDNAWARRIVQRRPYQKLLEILAPTGPEQEEASFRSLSSSFRARQLKQAKALRIPDALKLSEAEGLCQTLCDALDQEGFSYFRAESHWVLSHYFGDRSPTKPPLFVVDEPFHNVIPIEQYSPLYRRYAQGHKLVRVYCEPGELSRAYDLLRGIGGAMA